MHPPATPGEPLGHDPEQTTRVQLSIGPPVLTINQSAASVHRTRAVATEDGDIAQGTLALTITRVVNDGIHDDPDVVNYGLFGVERG